MGDRVVAALMPSSISWLGDPIADDASRRWPERSQSDEKEQLVSHYEACRVSGEDISLGDAVALRPDGEWENPVDEKSYKPKPKAEEKEEIEEKPKKKGKKGEKAEVK